MKLKVLRGMSFALSILSEFKNKKSILSHVMIVFIYTDLFGFGYKVMMCLIIIFDTPNVNRKVATNFFEVFIMYYMYTYTYLCSIK
jgi:hypothetical protein